MRHWSKQQRILFICVAAAAAACLCAAAVLLLTPARAAQPADGPAGAPVALALSSPTPAPEIAFEPDPDRPMPASGYRHARGDAFPIGGTVRANRPVTAVTITVTCAYNNDGPLYPYQHTVHMLPGSVSETYALTSADTIEGVSLAECIRFEEFQSGVHTLKLVASCERLRSVELLRVRFYVAGDDWEVLQPSDFNDSYREALAFFGDTSHFLYRYQWVNGRYTLADPDWEETYITSIEGLPAGETWRVHTDAVPYFEEALAYLQNTHVRVHGTNGDSGVLRLADLIATYNGCYVSRFTSSLKTISHHGFGTAIDINATMLPNLNEPENHAVIGDDVRNHLQYNGILTENGLSYYDYTYDGAYPDAYLGVPETTINYLLYELAFYRAGFRWAHYYRSTSDAMHFTLSEHVYGSHDDKNGLRKVFAYIETDAPAMAGQP
ncbi:MAG: M15 family metallopeptidase, partial [bacterium]|nr:M15 family metallopeptidase [bacterium]